MTAALRERHTQLAGDAERLQALSPLAVLQRGYAIARREDGSVVRAARQVQVGDTLDLTFHNGAARVRVESTREDT